MAYNHNSLPTNGAEISHVDLTKDEKDIVKLFLEGATSGSSPLTNPFRGDLESLKEKISTFRSYVIELNEDESNDDVVYTTLIAVFGWSF